MLYTFVLKRVNSSPTATNTPSWALKTDATLNTSRDILSDYGTNLRVGSYTDHLRCCLSRVYTQYHFLRSSSLIGQQYHPTNFTIRHVYYYSTATRS